MLLSMFTIAMLSMTTLPIVTAQQATISAMPKATIHPPSEAHRFLNHHPGVL